MEQKHYLKEQIMKTGYPLEIKISSLLRKKWGNVLNTDSYIDREEGKLRNIDITASNWYEPPKLSPLSLQTTLVIECKKTEKYAWVFFTIPFDFENSDIEGQFMDEIQVFSKNVENSEIRDMIFKKANFHYKQTKRIGIAYSEFYIGTNELKKKDKNKPTIFQAQNQVKKYIDCNFDQWIKTGSSPTLQQIEMDFPCIVFDGPLYEAIIEDEDVELIESNHVILSTTYKSPYAVYERCLLIDVVKKTYFEEYLKIVEKDQRSLRRILGKKSTRIINRTVEIMDLIGSVQSRK